MVCIHVIYTSHRLPAMSSEGASEGHKENMFRSVLLCKHPEHSLADLLSLHPIDKRIECRWHEEIQCGQKNMDMMGYMVTKVVSEEGENSRDIEDQDDTNMRSTCAKGLKAGLTPWYLQHCLEDVGIGNTNGQDI